MAKTSNKFGTFGGVFVPSVLTILGVIMYLRLPWVVGNGGLYLTLGIILAAHVISITTGLSISSIATDKKVGAGGPYYIVSRSLGLPIGGTLGLALFVGLSFSVSLYIIGFSESFLNWLGLPPEGNTIRICGTITIALVTAVTVISTALAIKTQYIILGLIVASLVSVAFGGGSPDVTTPHLESAPGSASFAVLFGIFFPAVTGFTAGVNMSGDLKDPKKSIPLGTMCAIATGLATYICLAVYLAYAVDPAQLTGNTQVLLEVAAFSPAVLGGIWGATLSSAMGSILGAPRILQALSVDRVTPRFFAKGAGKGNEPHRALWLAFAIAEAGILIGELDIIARIVSMFFMATYGFLNLSCAIESWASTDFRPSFKIPKSVSVIGAVTCLLIMVQLDLLALFGATALFAGLFVYLKRRELTLESGDTWEGVWSSMVRASLARLRGSRPQTGEYRPNVLCFSVAGTETRSHVVSLGETLVRQRGLLSDFVLPGTSKEGVSGGDDDEGRDEQSLAPGIFRRRLSPGNPYDSIASLMQFHGFAGLQPNTVMLAWSDHRDEPHEVARLLGVAAAQDMNVLLMAPRQGWEFPSRRRVDLWWAPDRGNFAFLLALARYITSDDAWQLAEVRFLVVNDQAAQTATLYRTATRLCTEGRLDATVKVLNNTLGERSFEDWVRRESAKADLVVLDLPDDILRPGGDGFRRTDEIIGQLGNVVLTRASSLFVDILSTTSESRLAAVTAHPAGDETLDVALPQVDLPPVPELAAETLRISGRLDGAAAEFAQACIGPTYRLHHLLLERTIALVDSAFTALREVQQASPSRQRKTAARVQNTFLQHVLSLMGDFAGDDLPTLKESLEQRVDWLFQEMQRIKEAAPAPQLIVYRGDSVERGEDSKRPRRRKRLRKTAIPLEALLSYYLDGEVPRHLHNALVTAARFGSDRVISLAKACNATRNSLGLVHRWVRDGELTEERLEQEYERVMAPLRAQEDESTRARRLASKQFLRAFRQLSIELAGDFMRPDLRQWVRLERRLPPEDREFRRQLSEAPLTWTTNEILLVRRAELELMVAVLGNRLAVIAERARDALAIELRSGIAADLERLLSSLETAVEKLEGHQSIRFDGAVEMSDCVDEKRVIEDLVRKTLAATATLPDSFETLNEESIVRIDSHPFDEADMITVPIRRRVEFLLEAEFVGRVGEGLGRATEAQRHALGVARDVIRLISYNINDIEADEDEEDPDIVRARLAPILAESIQRLQVERDKVLDFAQELSVLIDEQFALVTERTDAYAITGSEDGLRQYVGRERASHQALSRVSRLGDSLQRWGRDALGALLYRRSAGLVFARQLRSSLEPKDNLVEATLAFVQAHSPQNRVLRELPFYYQQPFLGKTRISADFWVGRREESLAARQALEHHRLGAAGALVVTGPRNSGKSAFCRTFANANFRRDRIHHIFPPPGGATEPALLQRALATELGTHGTVSALVSRVPEQTVLVFHDLELWWQRSARGMIVIEQLLELVDAYSHQCFFVFNLSTHPFRLLSDLTDIRDRALAVVNCGPLNAQCLRDIIMIRHKSTGLGLELAGRDLDSVPEWRLARLFGKHFDYSGGVVGVALQSWVAHVAGLNEKTLEIRNPSLPRSDILHELPMEWVSLLIALCLHGQVTEERLHAVTEMNSVELRHIVATLLRMGLVTKTKQGVIETNRFVDHAVTAHLQDRSLLS